jgi:hypothetical protein
VTTDELDQPASRRELNAVVEQLRHLSAEIKDLVRDKQVSWPLIISILGLALVVLGFGIKNLVDVATVKSVAESSSASILELRERTRALEAHEKAIQTENETQHKWLADVHNLELQRLDMMLALKLHGWPGRSYFPLSKIGGADSINGKH